MGIDALTLVGVRPEHDPEWAAAIWELTPTVIVMILSREGPFLVAERFTYNTDGSGLRTANWSCCGRLSG